MFDRIRQRLTKHREWRQVRRMLRRLRGGCTEEEFRTFRCPQCGAPMRLDVSPDKTAFFFYCSESTLHYAPTREVRRCPPWWDAYVSNGWLSDPAAAG